MKRIQKLASASILALALSVSAFAGDISGGRTGNISGGSINNAAPSRNGDISGGRAGDISGGAADVSSALLSFIMTIVAGR